MLKADGCRGGGNVDDGHGQPVADCLEQEGLLFAPALVCVDSYSDGVLDPVLTTGHPHGHLVLGVADPGDGQGCIGIGNTKNQVAVWVTGGENGVQYNITITIDTDKGRRKEQSFLLRTSGAGSAVTIVYVSDTTAAVRYSR